MKKVLAFILAMAMMFSLAACVSDAGSAPEATEGKQENLNVGQTQTDGNKADDQLIFGISFPVSDAMMTFMMDNMKAGLEKRGVKVYTTSAGGSNEKQLGDVEDLISKGCDGIFLMGADADAMTPAVTACNEAGIPVIIGRDVNIDSWDAYFMVVDNYTLGRKQAEYLIENFLKKNPQKTYNIGYMSGTQANLDAVLRRDGVYETLEASGCTNWKWIVENDGNFVTETAQSCAEAWCLSHPEINVVISGSDDMSLGVYNAFQAAGLEKDLIILSIDANDVGLSMIEEGQMEMTLGSDVIATLQDFFPEFVISFLQGTYDLPEDKIARAGDLIKDITIDNVAEFKASKAG